MKSKWYQQIFYQADRTGPSGGGGSFAVNLSENATGGQRCLPDASWSRLSLLL